MRSANRTHAVIERPARRLLETFWPRTSTYPPRSPEQSWGGDVVPCAALGHARRSALCCGRTDRGSGDLSFLRHRCGILSWTF